MTRAVLALKAQTIDVDKASTQNSQNCVAQSLFDKEFSKYSLLREKVLKTPYVSRLLPLHQWIKSKSCFLFTDEETGASKRMEV